jgi:Zinc-finger of C2H2 type
MTSSIVQTSDTGSFESIPLTAAELLRRTKRQRRDEDAQLPHEQEVPSIDSINDNNKKESVSLPGEDDLDEEIKRLEAKLGNESDDDNDDDESDSTGDSAKVEGKTMILSSSLKEDRIESLPESCLPTSKRRTLKGIDRDFQSNDGNVERKNKSRKRGRSEFGVGENSEVDEAVSEEIKDAVKKILGNYQPRSVERLPFYCRCCAVQSESEETFMEHKKTLFHVTAVQMEQKASFCKLCRKQLTSPAQLKEHLQSKPHKQRLDMLRSRQPQSNNKNNSYKSSFDANRRR